MEYKDFQDKIKTYYTNAFRLESNKSDYFRFLVTKVNTIGKYLEVYCQMIKELDEDIENKTTVNDIAKNTTKFTLTMYSLNDSEILDTFKYDVKYLYSIPAKIDYADFGSSPIIKYVYEII